MRWVHYVAMTIVIVNLIVRLWYAFASKRRDYREFAITRRDITTAPMVIAYYLFLIPPEKKPHLGKYNVMQKSTYMIVCAAAHPAGVHRPRAAHLHDPVHRRRHACSGTRASRRATWSSAGGSAR